MLEHVSLELPQLDYATEDYSISIVDNLEYSIYTLYTTHIPRPRCCGLGFLRNTKAPLLGLTLWGR
jgi:hypothetical protein